MAKRTAETRVERWEDGHGDEMCLFGRCHSASGQKGGELKFKSALQLALFIVR